MPLSKQQEKEVLQVYDTWLHSYLNGDVATYDSYFDEDYHFIGSTGNEEFLTRKETTKFFEKTADQLAGKSDLRNETKIIEQFGELIFITHLFDAWFYDGNDWFFYSRFRFTNALRKNKAGWRFIYQHYSTPDAKAQEGETIGYEKVSAENQELREAIKRRTFELEQKNRELEIETALERVRYRAIAMRHSDELSEAAELLYKEFLKMGVESFSCGYLVNDDEKQEWKVYLTNPGEPFFKEFWTVPYKADKHLKARYDSWKHQEEFHCAILKGEENRSHHMVISKYAPWKAQMLDSLPAQLVFNSAHFSMGHLLVISPERLTAELEQAMVRFAGVFDLAYLRFLDLQKAEKQARETQIDSALERIRAQVTSMQESSDLLDIVVTMRKEFVRLGHEAHYFWHMRWHPDKYEKAMTSGDGSRIGMVMELPRRIHGEIKQLAEWEKSDEPTVIFPMDVEATLDYVHKMASWGDFEHIDPNMPTEDDIRHIGGLTYVMARTSLGEIGYSLPGIVKKVPQAELEVLVRFARAFDLAHKRFEDLKTRERQARETQIELALEKVRSRTMGMQHSDELPEVANLLFRQIQTLGINVWSTAFNIFTEDKATVICNVSSEGQLQPSFRIPLTEEQSFKAWHDAIEREDSFFEQELGGVDLGKHYEYLFSLPGMEDALKPLEEEGISLPTFQVNHICTFKHGFLLFITYEKVPDAHSIFKRFTNVFEQTYIRFLDLELKEEQSALIKQEKERLEKTLNDLQATQKQLIQSEKMASLGQLTAGIAHEIQNPLNFVNNFSEVSVELLGEMVDEIERGDKAEAFEIINDLKSNLKKILEHGKRADGIVKGMLMHSRGGSGEKAPTDINALCDEYLRLAYHGLRAKDKSFNSEMVIAFDEQLPQIEIVQQDIGRVILNLIMNAFQAVNEKRLKEQDAGYRPAVTVKTANTNGNLKITVADNGGGIPDNIREKIFQPFFTTKPTGQGTGLGLSLSYDIVKAHGGEIKVKSQVKEGTAFIIFLPIVNK